MSTRRPVGSPNWNLEMQQQRGTAILTFRVDQSLPRTKIGGRELLLYFRNILGMQNVEPVLTQQVTLCNGMKSLKFMI